MLEVDQHYNFVGFVDGSTQGVTKRCRLSWLTNGALVYEPKCGACGVSAIRPNTGAQINVGDLTPYLNYGSTDITNVPPMQDYWCCSRRYCCWHRCCCWRHCSHWHHRAVLGVPSVAGIASNADASLLQASPIFMLSLRLLSPCDWPAPMLLLASQGPAIDYVISTCFYRPSFCCCFNCCCRPWSCWHPMCRFRYCCSWCQCYCWRLCHCWHSRCSWKCFFY